MQPYPDLARGLFLVLLAVGFGSPPAFAANDTLQLVMPLSSLPQHPDAANAVAKVPKRLASQGSKRADFAQEIASRHAQSVADWVLDSGDNLGMPFAIVDKTAAKVFIFTADGHLSGAAPALLGMAIGDDAIPGIGDRPMSSIRPEERTTPAGRFVAALGRNSHNKEILWVDYDGAVSMHPVITTNPKERRAQRLATPTPLDNRISFGCINVPVKFYENVVHTTFAGTDGIVYVLPENRLPREVFGSYDVQEHVRLQTASKAMPTQADSGGAQP